MAWAYVAGAVLLGGLAAGWLRHRPLRRADDTIHRALPPWWIPVAVAVGATLAGPFFAWRPPAVVLTYLVALVWGVALTHVDLEVRRLPDALVLPAYPVAAALLASCSALTGNWPALLEAAACAGGAVAGFGLLAVLSAGSEGLGLGDVKLAGVLGALLGWWDWSNAVFGLLTGFVIGGLVAGVLLVSRRARRGSSMAFGPAMILGAYLWCLLPTVG